MTPLELMQRFRVETICRNLAGFSMRECLFPHRRFSEITGRIAEQHHYSVTNKAAAGLMIAGPSGVGKTSLIRFYQEQFPRFSDGGVTRIPVLTVSTPAGPTVKNLAQAILASLGDPAAHRGSAEEKTQRIHLFLERCEVEIVFLDEFHHFFYTESTKHFRHISDWLKGLMDASHVALILVGLPEGEEVVKANPQLWRRFSSRSLLSAFNFEDADDFIEFRGLMKAFQEALPLEIAVPLHEGNLARRFWVASDGRLDYVRKILEGAVSVANTAGIRCLDLPVYASAFRNQIWDRVSERLNPFHPDSILRPLTRGGEPFESGGYASMIGSPVARRLGLAHYQREGTRA
jgi:hypothetical protein